MKDKICIICEEKFTPRRIGQKVCSIECSFKVPKKVKKDNRAEAYSKENKKSLQDEVQKLARIIDKRFGYITCIDCDRPFGKQTDGGHFHSKGHNKTISLNLHNIHSQDSQCNGFFGGKQLQYYEGLIRRYGIDYANYVKDGLQQKYTYIGLKNIEIPDYLAIVRKLIRNFDTYVWSDAIQARDQCNTIIGIYK